MPVPVTRRSGRGGTIALFVAGLVAAAGLAFAVGRLTAPAAASSGQPVGGVSFGPGRSLAPGETFAPGGGQLGGGRALAGGLTVRGEVTAVATDSITVKLDDGTTVQIPLNSSTTYHQATSGAASDISVGDKVAVQANAPTFTSGGPGSTPAASPGAADGRLQLGPAVDVTVVKN
jgi:hypothetical protein